MPERKYHITEGSSGTPKLKVLHSPVEKGLEGTWLVAKRGSWQRIEVRGESGTPQKMICVY